MGIVNFAKAVYLSHFSRPAGDRVLYRTIRGGGIGRILEIGLASQVRTMRMIDLARRAKVAPALRYVAIDLFEARPNSLPTQSLKETHRWLKPLGVQAQLIPGDASALARAANALGQLDLILISDGQDSRSLQSAWFYVPRLLHAGTKVMVESRPAPQGEPSWRIMAHEELQQLAASGRGRRAA